MKYFWSTILALLFTFALHGQSEGEWLQGTVSFLSSRNVYVKFSSTKNIEIGDSLYTRQRGQYLPALIVDNRSSTSTVCTPIFQEGPTQVGDIFFARVPIEKKKKAEELPSIQEAQDTTEQDLPEENTTVITPEEDGDGPSVLYRSKANGRISAGSYSNFSDYRNVHRMRYAFTYRATHLKNSRFSIDNYIAFRHTIGEWEEVQANLGRALKIYSLAVSYDIDSTARLTLGRKINPRTSSLGAIDGLQFEKRSGRLVFGGIVGSRPDFQNYSLNLSLLQAGAYVSFLSKNPASYQQTTLGFIEQRNHGQTDRRFAYFQHSSSPIRSLNLFSSFELDLYQRIGEQAGSHLRLANLYVSARYRLSKKWRLSASYDNRKNIIYYESYKSQIEQLIENETRQGLRFGFNVHPVRLITIGVNAGWRFQKSDLNLSKNLNCFINISQIPKLKTRASLTFNILETNYLNSHTLGIRFSKPIVRRRLDADLYYRMVNYQYQSTGIQVQQHIAGAGFSFRIQNNLSLHANYEGTFDSRGQTYQRFNSRLIQRFK